ncbi:MAG: methyltransferase domain-containing protein [Aridibacter famidurans]|nr:methyltransferase domain-containing protein [Aridibacter famidurans]
MEGFQRVALDIGTGDGRFVLRLAESEPETYWIGIDANAKPLHKTSTKAARQLGKGRCANALFVHASAEDLPEEFDGIADEIYINFPWGSLLGAVLRPDFGFLATLARILADRGTVTMTTGIDPQKDRRELERFGIEALCFEDLTSRMLPAYSEAGFDLIEAATAEKGELLSGSTWERKLRHSNSRSLFRFRFRLSPRT